MHKKLKLKDQKVRDNLKDLGVNGVMILKWKIINALPGDSSVNTFQHATIEEALFSVEATDAPIDWLASDHVICVYCRPMSVPQLYNKSDRICSRLLRVAVATEAREQASKQ
jgi:hypothetical protein